MCISEATYGDPGRFGARLPRYVHVQGHPNHISYPPEAEGAWHLFNGHAGLHLQHTVVWRYGLGS